MIKEITYKLHRLLFARCQGCGARLGSHPAFVYGYEWNGWLRSENGLWHGTCMRSQMDYDREEERKLDAIINGPKLVSGGRNG